MSQKPADSEAKTAVRVDSYTRACLTAIVVLLTLLVLGLWSERFAPAPAQAGPGGANGTPQAIKTLGNAGQQREAMVDQQTQTNRKLDEIIRLLRSGDVKVRISDDKPARQFSPATTPAKKE